MYARQVALLATPIGMVRLAGSAEHLGSITILDAHDGTEIEPTSGALLPAADQLRAWFTGELTTFDLALTPAATSRGAALRQGMAEIGYGETISYGALGAGGSLGHYSAGGGAATKTWLLDHERRRAGNTLL